MWERLRNFGGLRMLASVLVTIVLGVIAFRMLYSPPIWSSGTAFGWPSGPTAEPTELATITPSAEPSTSPSPTASPAQQTTRHEAENAAFSPDCVVAANHAGHSGTGFVDYANAVGSYVQWTVPATKAGKVTIRLRYANGTTANRPMDILVNSTVAAPAAAFGSTGTWDQWSVMTLSVTLRAGPNTIQARATSANGGPNVDYLEVRQ